MNRVRILNVDVENVRFGDFVASLTEGAVFTPNVDHLLKLQSDREFYEAYQRAEHVVCDSRILQWLSQLLYPGGGLVDIVPGSDLLPAYCAHLARAPARGRVFLLGGSEVSVRAAQARLNEEAQRDVVVDAYSPPFGFEHDAVESANIVERVNRAGATVLAVGVGAPKQELWIHRHRHAMPGVRVFLAVGAGIDFAGGRVARAPRWINRVGLEWLYRLAQEPRRLGRRYLVDDPRVLALILRQRLGRYRNPWD